MTNPYFFGGRVTPSQFIGREKELRNIFNCLEVVHSGQVQSVSIVGPHRIGRSSLLYFIANRYSRYFSKNFCESLLIARFLSKLMIFANSELSYFGVGFKNSSSQSWQKDGDRYLL